MKSTTYNSPIPKEYKNKTIIERLVNVAKKANMKPMEYFETKLAPCIEERNIKQNIDFAKKELNVCFVDENETASISEQIEKIISRLPAKEKKRWQTLKA